MNWTGENNMQDVLELHAYVRGEMLKKRFRPQQRARFVMVTFGAGK